MKVQSLHKINEISSILVRTPGEPGDLPSVLQHIAQTAQAAFATDACVVLAFNPITGSYIGSQAVVGDSHVKNELLHDKPRRDGVTQQVLGKKDGVICIEDLDVEPQYHNRFTFKEGFRAFAGLAMRTRHRQRPLGVIYLDYRQPKKFSSTDYESFRIFTVQAALLLQETWLARNYKEVARIGQQVNQNLDRVDDLFQELQTFVDSVLDNSHMLLLATYQPQTNTLNFYTSGQECSIFMDRPLQGACKHVIETQESWFIRQLSQEKEKLPFQIINVTGNEENESLIFVPLMLRGVSLGVLSIQHSMPNAYGQEDLFILQLLANYISLALHNMRLYNSLNQLEEASILLRNPHIMALEIPAALGPHAEARRTHIISLQETKGITRWVFEHKKPARVDNVHRDSHWRGLYIEAAADTVSELDVPLLDGGEIVGVLNFESPRERAFRQEDEDFLLTLAGQAVLAIKNAQAYEREKRLAEEGRVLNQISKEITSQLDLVYVFNLILEKALELTHSTLGSLHLFDPDLNDLYMVAEHGVAEDKKGQRQKLGQGIVGYVAKHRQLQNIEDVTQYPWNEIYVEFFPGAHSELAVPMLAGDELRGVLNVESPSPNNFNESDERLLQALADLAVVALQNAELYKKAEREAQRFKLLYQAGQELGKITDLEQLEQAYDAIVQIADRQSQSQAVIYRYDETHAEVVLKCASPYRQAPLFERIKLNEGISGQVARERRAIVVHDIDNLPPDVVAVKQSDPRMHSLVVTPILFEDRYYGNLGLRHEAVGHFQGADILFFEGLAQQLASTIYRLETAKARKESEQRAKSAEAMSDIGHMAFELTHRWDNDLGLVRSYVNDIQSELEQLGVANAFISKKLENIVQASRTVLDLSKDLKQELVRSGEAIASEPVTTQFMASAGKPVVIQPRLLLEEAMNVLLLPPTVEMCLEIDEDAATVLVIHSLVADILRNLVFNAVDAMPDGGKITLRARNAGNFVALEVIDTGIGIPQQNLSKIFDLFYSTKGSSGFGLWSARRNAFKNRGDLTVKSEVGQGTTFTLLLPRVEGGII